MYESAFAQEQEKGYPYRYRGVIHVDVLAGGTPTNPDVAEAWIKAKGWTGELKDELLRTQVAEVMAERGVSADEAVELVAKNRHLTGFKRVPTDPKLGARDVGYPDHAGELYIEGRQLKACLKEAASVAADVKKIVPRGWGDNKKKGVISFMSEHVFVVERRLYLAVTEPSDVHQSFVHTYRGSGIQYTEVIEDAVIEFTVEADRDLSDKSLVTASSGISDAWAAIWTTAERQGLGAGRSQGYGRFTITEWEPIAAQKPARVRKAA